MLATRRSRSSGVAPLEEIPEDEPLPIALGDVVAGKYRVTRILGVGGMGVVAAADHEELDQAVALKIMRTERKTPETVERFLREARAAVRLKSSHVAKVRDVGTLPNGLPFMVMDFLEGSDLYTLSRERGPLPLDEAVDYILQACDAIAEAHAIGIVHRDIKPENLFLTTKRDGSPHVRVLDFGVSKIGPAPGELVDGPNKRSVTHETAIIGSPSYMSPEQIRSAKTVDARTDIWALGCTLFELLTGQEAFGADNAPDIFVKVLEKPPPPLHVMRPELPPGIEEVVNRCLEKDRDLRYESVDAFANALMAFTPRRSTSMPPTWRDYIQVDIDYDALKPALLPASAHATEPGMPPAVPRRKAAAKTIVIPGRAKSRRRRNIVIALAALAFVGSAVAVLWVIRAGRGPAVARTPASAETAPASALAPEPPPSAKPAAETKGPEPAPAPSVATPAFVAVASASASASPPVTKGGKRPSRPKGGTTTTAGPAETANGPTPPHRTDW